MRCWGLLMRWRWRWWWRWRHLGAGQIGAGVCAEVVVVWWWVYMTAVYENEVLGGWVLRW